ncbi:MAG: hypothetical protein ACRDK7_16235 [Solirubrobacteraceae bacterium]
MTSTITDPCRIERAIVLLVLDDAHAEVWSRAEIEVALRRRDTRAIGNTWAINDALAHLSDEGVVRLEGEQVRASRCVRHIDSLGLICV